MTLIAKDNSQARPPALADLEGGTQMSIKELEAKAQELKELQRMAEELNAEMDTIKDATQ